LNHQNNYVELLNIDDNATKSSSVLAIRTSYIIILMVQTKLFSDLYLVKFLDSSAKSFFSFWVPTYVNCWVH